VALLAGDARGFTPLWNGTPFAVLERIPRPDVPTTMPWLTPEGGWLVEGFNAHTGLHPDLPAAGGWLRVEPGDAAGRPRPDLGPPSCLRVPTATDPPWPDPVRRRRVHGDTDLTAFRRLGGTAFLQLREALRRCLSADLTDFPRVLDWGCGCGRVLRHFADLPGCRVTGVDVDADNVEWSREHLPFADFATVPLHPPTALPAGGFDLAFGVSVFTHLREPDQFEWLAELARVVRPGGVVLVTYHGAAAVATSRLPKALHERLGRHGFLDFANELYDAALPEPDYYRNTYHTDEYIRREWGKYFEVTTLLPLWIGSQNLAVLRRR
jgi:SAM-dependent methyltransferase